MPKQAPTSVAEENIPQAKKESKNAKQAKKRPPQRNSAHLRKLKKKN
jgi:hypothetical protein